jgi:hypothetical protein
VEKHVDELNIERAVEAKGQVVEAVIVPDIESQPVLASAGKFVVAAIEMQMELAVALQSKKRDRNTPKKRRSGRKKRWKIDPGLCESMGYNSWIKLAISGSLELTRQQQHH